ncbi:hypothetical protein EKH55_3215 [Sinorhizobium alkalisoli]|nr:hypothetical protein EKH55_3215 [Sinorhizobium alkalisoli]
MRETFIEPRPQVDSAVSHEPEPAQSARAGARNPCKTLTLRLKNAIFMHHPARDSQRAVGFATTIAPSPADARLHAFQPGTMTADGGHDRV